MIAIAVRQTRNQLGERQVPLMGIMAAFIFAAQAINFPVAAGTSGHLLGGAFAAIVMGPWAATLMMTAVIAIQALLFQDGGLLVMGWNILNMGVFATFAGYAGYAFMKGIFGDRNEARLSGAFLGAWISVEVSAMATAFELAASGTSPIHLALPAMAGIYALIGLGEALITTGGISFLLVTRPEVVRGGETAPGRKGALAVAFGLAISLGLAILSPLASSKPDGLEFIAEKQGFLTRMQRPLLQILPDYTVSGVSDQALATMLAVAVGTLVVFGIALLVGRTAARRQRSGD
jgi:cobalt/nickel transport system permease protein